ncbi:FAD dependent oxidoreductase family protein, partial [Metarhizium majus ARSEF 297]
MPRTAERVLVAIPPMLKNICTFDLAEPEHAIFSKFSSSLDYFAGVAKVPGFNGSLTNIGAQTPFNQPIVPGNNAFIDTGSPGEFSIGGGFDSGDVTDEQGKDLVRKNLATLAAMGAVPEDAAETVTFPYTSNHSPYNMRVTAEDIKAGFYTKLLALQGTRNTVGRKR